MADPTAANLATGTWVGIVVTSSVVAAIVTAGTNWLLAARATKQAATYSAIRLATTLESFARECTSELDDHQAFVDSKGQIGDDKPNLPRFPAYPDDIDWKSLPVALSERALTLPSDVELDARGVIRFMWDVEGPMESDTTVEKTAESGLQALNLAADLRRAYHFPAFQGAKALTATMQEQLNHSRSRREDSGQISMPPNGPHST